MNISGLNALDPRVAATEKFISDKKIPPEQVTQFLLRMGADPKFVGLVAKYERLQTASAQGQPAQAPQTTVAQDIDARQQGIAGLPAPVIDRAKFASGGIVAFQEGGNEGLEGIDFTKMTSEQLQTLASGNDRNLARAAYKEYLRRSGYRTPGQIASDVGTGVSEFFANTRIAGGAPDYMRDEQGRIRTPANEAGAKSVTSSFTEGTTPFRPPAAAAPVAAPSAVASPTAAAMTPGQAGSAFDAAINNARLNVRQDQRPAAGTARPSGAGTRTDTGAGQINEGLKLLRDQVNALKNMKPEDREARYRAAGIEDITPKQLAKIEERISKLSGDKKRDAYMALAQAGFKMAAAASRPGASVLGAFGEGASEGAKMMADINKEYRNLQNDLEDKVMAIQRYQQDRREGKIDKDIEREDRLQTNLREAERNLATYSESIRQFGISSDLQRQQIAATAGQRSESSALAQKTFKLEGLRAQIDNAQKRLVQASKSLEPDAAAKVADIEREIASYNRQIAELGGATPYESTPPVQNTGEYSKLSNAEIRRMLGL